MHMVNRKRKLVMVSYLRYIIGLYGLLSWSVQAQKKVTTQSVLWEVVNLSASVKGYPIQVDIQERHFVTPVVQHQFLFRAQAGKDIGANWKIFGGGCYFLQSPNDPDAENRLTVPELRPHVEAGYQQKYASWQISHRYRAEARFYHQQTSDKKALAEGYEFSHMRFRYRLQAVIPIGHILSKNIAINLNEEVLLNVGKKIKYNVFDQNRIYAGIVVGQKKNQVEMGYLNWFQQQSSGVDFYDRHILRIGFNYKI